MENILENPVSSAESTNSILKPIQTPAQPEQPANPILLSSNEPTEKRIGFLRKVLNSLKGQEKPKTTSPETPPQDQSEEIKMSPATKRFLEGTAPSRVEGGVPTPQDNTAPTQQ